MQSYIIKRLSEKNRGKCLEHFLRLDSESVYTRFCAPLKEEALTNYVKKMNFEKDGIFGVFDIDLNIVGIGECVLESQKDSAEVAFSVEKDYQGQGLGNKLMERVVRFAKSQNKHHLEMVCLRTNAVTVHLAQKHGLHIQSSYGESHAVIDMDEVNPVLENLNEVVDDSLANYALQQRETIQNWKESQKIMGSVIGEAYSGLIKMMTPRAF